MDPRQNSPVASACRFPFSFPPLFTPRLPLTDYLVLLLTGLWRSRPRSTNPAFLTTRLRSLHCFMNACCWLMSAWHPHGICSFSSHTRRSFYFDTRVCELAALWRRRYWFRVFTIVQYWEQGLNEAFDVLWIISCPILPTKHSGPSPLVTGDVQMKVVALQFLTVSEHPVFMFPI